MTSIHVFACDYDPQFLPKLGQKLGAVSPIHHVEATVPVKTVIVHHQPSAGDGAIKFLERAVTGAFILTSLTRKGRF